MVTAEGSGGEGGTVATATAEAATNSGYNNSGPITVVLERLGGQCKVYINEGRRRRQ